ncbi:hypothetical protein SKAU_G00212930 [Synaphobranchus kaupii]|uniref:Uncharacterized protein n=1 Tax=Synaphobranchus kaupii TaxID=118154 RepID=A0A9Q1F985_SYNKA|nr:hypothetical protein SKAU_G00212930 [Synaphobranchus kaupii]
MPKGIKAEVTGLRGGRDARRLLITDPTRKRAFLSDLPRLGETILLGFRELHSRVPERSFFNYSPAPTGEEVTNPATGQEQVHPPRIPVIGRDR